MASEDIKISHDAEMGIYWVRKSNKVIGSIWATNRGCCYRHKRKDIPLESDEMNFIVGVMRSIEGSTR